MGARTLSGTRGASRAVETRVREVMLAFPFRVQETAPLGRTWESFLRQGLRSAPVVDGKERLVGLLLRADLARAILDDEPTVSLRPERGGRDADRHATV